MTTIDNYRTMIARLADELEFNRRCLMDDATAKHPLAERARALLAEPEVVGVPTDGEICGLYAALFGLNSDALGPMPVKFARAVLARYGTPAPVPVAEPNFRALSKDLADDLALWMEYGQAPANLPLKERNTYRLLKRARTLLAAPEVVGVADEELMAIYFRFKGRHGIFTEGTFCDAAKVAIASFAHPAPVPVDERLPGEGDCCPHPRRGIREWCWGLENARTSYGLECVWRLIEREDISTYASHWLPHWALPLPGVQQ